MTIYRNRGLKKGYFIASNGCVQDKRLSLKAKGLLALILSLPENFQIRVHYLVSLSRDGRDSVYSALAELKNAGYIIHTRERGEDGRLGESSYDVYDEPQQLVENEDKSISTNDPNSPYPEKPDVGEEGDLVSPHPGNPDREKSHREKPDLANPSLQNNKYINNKIKKITATKAAAEKFNRLKDEDTKIRETLTPEQTKRVKVAAEALVLAHYPAPIEQIIEEMTTGLLSKKAYSKIGMYFPQKLKAIINSMQSGTWSKPKEMLEKQDQLKNESLRDLRFLQSDIAGLERLIENHAVHYPADDKTLTQLEAQIRLKREEFLKKQSVLSEEKQAQEGEWR